MGVRIPSISPSLEHKGVPPAGGAEDWVSRIAFTIPGLNKQLQYGLKTSNRDFSGCIGVLLLNREAFSLT